MIIYTEEKLAQQSVYYKRILNADGNEISNRKVTNPLYSVSHNDFTYYILYDDHMKVISEAYEYLNFDLQERPLTSRSKSAFALRLLYCFLSLSGYDVHSINDQVLSELLFFLRGIRNNPSDFDSRTQRSSATVNSYLSVYRYFFSRRHIKCDALFRAFNVSVTGTVEQTFSSTVERKRYKSNLKTSSVDDDLCPRYIGPEDFRKIYSHVLQKQDQEAKILLHLMYGYGLRLGECLGLTMEDITEAHENGKLVPILLIRNRMSDAKYQYAKNLLHVTSRKQYKSRDYQLSRWKIIITYELYEELLGYIESAHSAAIEKYPANYEKGAADIVSVREAPESNHYVFLNRYGRVLSDQTWNTHLKNYFSEAGIPIDHDVREKNLSHRFRHGFAMFHARFSEHPVAALELSRMLRHKSILSTMVYYNPTFEDELKAKTEFQNELYALIPELKEPFNEPTESDE